MRTTVQLLMVIMILVSGAFAAAQQPCQVSPATGSAWQSIGSNIFELEVGPGVTIDDALTVTDPDGDSISVTVTGYPPSFTGLYAQPGSTTAPTPGPLQLLWNGVCDASNPPGTYSWKFDVSDRTYTIQVQARIRVLNVAPTYTPLNIANYGEGDGTNQTGSGQGPYDIVFQNGDDSSEQIRLVEVSDPNTTQNVYIDAVTPLQAPSGGTDFVVTQFGNTIKVAPSGSRPLGIVDEGLPSYRYSIDLTDGQKVTKLYFDIWVAGAPSGSFQFSSPSTLPSMEPGTPYTHTLTANGGISPYFYYLYEGTLPKGTTLDPTNGVISGIPNTPGHYIFKLRVIDDNFNAATKEFSVEVLGGPPQQESPKGDDGGCSTRHGDAYHLVLILGLLAIALGVRLRRSAC